MALFSPAWQSSVSEQVPAETLPAGRRAQRHQLQHRAQLRTGDRRHRGRDCRLGRGLRRQRRASIFRCSLCCSCGDRVSEPSRLPRERLNRAMISGVRYISNSPSIRIVLTRTVVTGMIGGSVSALMPLVARDLLHGSAQTYGTMLGALRRRRGDRRAEHRPGYASA